MNNDDKNTGTPTSLRASNVKSNKNLDDLKQSTISLKESTKILKTTEAQLIKSEKVLEEAKDALKDFESNKNNPPNNKESSNDELNLLKSIDLNVKNINSTSNTSGKTLLEISSKLGVLSDKLKAKYDGKPKSDIETPVKNDSLSDVLVEKYNTNETNEVKTIPEIIPKEGKKSEDLLVPKSEDKDTAKDNMVINGLVAVKGAVSAGFKKSADISNRIAGTLFKFVSADLIQAAKISAAVLAIVLGIDVLKTFWQAWGDAIMAKIDEFAVKFGEWWNSFKGWADDFSDMKGAFDNMEGSLMGIKNAWESGDFPGLALTIGKAIFDFGKTIDAILIRAVTKLGSTILNALGFKDAAKSVEAEGLEYYQNMTDAKLSDENAKKVAENQNKKEKKDNLTPSQRGITSVLPDSFRKKVGILSENEYNQIQAEKKDQSIKSNLSDEQKIANTMATNEARKAVARYEKIAKNVNPSNKNDVATADKYKKEAQDYINQKSLSYTPSVKSELQSQLDSISFKPDAKSQVSPAKSIESKDTQVAKKINYVEANKKNAKDIVGNSIANVNNTVIRNNRSINMQAPITSTQAPGIFKATGVN